MSLMLFNQNKLILRISSGGFSGFYDKIMEIIEEKNIKLNNVLKNLIDELYSGKYGMGLDISEYLRTKKDTLFFAELVKDAIDKFIQQSPTLTEKSKESFWNFHNELLYYAKELK